MRYEEWDILLFPRDGKVPLKEFKVACHVVHDNELSHIHGSLGLPTVCCFVPSLPPSAPYKLSIHSWSTPPISQFTRSCGKFVDRVVFEVRLFVDGRLVSSSVMNRAGPWPNILKHSFELSETGELNSLTFPVFQRELLDQSYWSPADDLGRIKVVISESYPRDSLTVPFERVKNIVAFSFQHAPLEILESSAIAWPNASMFRAMPFTASALLPTKHSDSSGSHAHSPRPRSSMVPAKSSLTEVASDPALLHPGKYTAEPKPLTFSDSDALSSSNLAAADPFVEANAYFEWLSGIGMGLNSDPSSSVNTEAASRVNRKSSTDASMPDYVSCVETPAAAENRRDSFAPKINSEGDSSHMKVPTNTPTTCDINITEAEDAHFTMLSTNTPISASNSASTSFLSQSVTISPQILPTPAMKVKSRKENKAKQLVTPPPVNATISLSGEPASVRRISQQLFRSDSVIVKPDPVCESPSRHASAEKSGKRLRNFTPTSAKYFEDDEEPPRASPRLRLGALDEAATK